MSKIIISPPRAQKRASPNWVDLIVAYWVLFTKLSPRQRAHTIAALSFGCFCIGGIALLIGSQAFSSGPSVTKIIVVEKPHNLAIPMAEVEVVDEEETEMPFLTKPVKRPNAAPKSVAEVGKYSPEAYIRRYADIAVQGMRQYKVPASITLAQGLIEGRAGTSFLAVNNNNHFGIKCFSTSCKKGHCSNATDDTHKDFFRKYPTVKQCFDDHGQKISSGRYKKLLRYGKNYRQWAYGLKACGYATDRTYAEKLIGVIERYDLNRFDR